MTNYHWRIGGIIFLGTMALTGLVLSSCSTVSRTAFSPPEIEGATFLGNAACADCHENISTLFPESPHGRFHREEARWAGMTGCESCHGPGSKHVASGGAREWILNPGRDATICFNCHLDTHAEFRLPHRHPVLEGHLNCVQCHDPHGRNIFQAHGGLTMGRVSENCAACHREQARPVIFEHEALREGCVTCHRAHGSINSKLLVERDNNLCLKCHAQVRGTDVPGGEIYIGKVPHAAFLRRGTCWSAGCHSSVHGSNIHPLMFY